MRIIDRSSAVRRAIDIFNSHPVVLSVTGPITDETSDVVSVTATFEVNLFSEWRRKGESPSGVRRHEEVLFKFPNGFPMVAPTVSLRPDFSRNFPHMMPWLDDNRPIPCIYDGYLSELLHGEGVFTIVNQMALWLQRAADGTLMDPEQGWEPVRRDGLENLIEADAKFLQDLALRPGRWVAFPVDQLRIATDGAKDRIHARVLRTPFKVNEQSVAERFNQNDKHVEPGLYFGKSIAIVAIPGKQSSSEPIVCEEYLPEDVRDLKSLKTRARLYGCSTELNSGLSHFEKSLAKLKRHGSIKLVVILLARRPYRVIGTHSNIELCPYVVDFQQPSVSSLGSKTTVHAAGHLHSLSRSLLAQMSGHTSSSDTLKWTLIGAGSLGSKLALHLARAGNAPSVVIDRSHMSPHNAARHALIPPIHDEKIGFVHSKAKLLTQAIEGLDQRATAHTEDITKLLSSERDVKKICAKDSWAVVDTTGAHTVRQALGAVESLSTRVIETSLLARGRVGVVMVEGRNRNPNIADLEAQFYSILQEDRELGKIVFDPNDTLARQSTGQGCGSMTMVLSDGRISQVAASIAEYLSQFQQEGLPEKNGEILIGRLGTDGLSLMWKSWEVAPVHTVQTRESQNWRVHIHERAMSKMKAETKLYPDVETGGVIMGRVSEISRTAHVVDLIDAPDDSVRSALEFVLGTDGMTSMIRQYTKRVNGNLFCLGTWHSHLTCSGPSDIDLKTFANVAISRLKPSVFLILTPSNIQAYVAE